MNSITKTAKFFKFISYKSTDGQMFRVRGCFKTVCAGKQVSRENYVLCLKMFCFDWRSSNAVSDTGTSYLLNFPTVESNFKSKR